VRYRSGHYDVCTAIRRPARHVKGKGSKVNRNEGLRAKLRARLNRLVRRTHGYSKRLYMLVGSIAMAPLRDGLYHCQLV